MYLAVVFIAKEACHYPSNASRSFNSCENVPSSPTLSFVLWACVPMPSPPGGGVT